MADFLFKWISVFIVLVGTVACQSMNMPPDDSPPSQEEISKNYRFSDVPVPEGFKLDRDRSFIYEANSSSIKVGRLIYSGFSSMSEVTGFYQNEMVNNGWTLIRTIEHSGTILLYEKEGWICDIILQSSFAGKTVAEVQVGPR